MKATEHKIPIWSGEHMMKQETIGSGRGEICNPTKIDAGAKASRMNSNETRRSEC